MGADQIGFLFKGPAKLDRGREHRAMAIRRGNEVIAAIRAYRPDHPHPSVIDHLDPDDLADLAEDPGQLPDPGKLVRRLVRWWHEGARDTCIGPDPDDPSQRIGFAGERTWGDEPSGLGYAIIRDGYRLNILHFFCIRGPLDPARAHRVTRSSDAIRDLLRDAIDAWPQFEEDADVNGAELVEWFGEWRRRARELLESSRGS
jgi:hypothetical protein